MARPMQVRIECTIQIEDPDQWSAAIKDFTGTGRRDIRSAVRRYIIDGIPGWGVFGNGEVKADVVRSNDATD